MKLLEIKMDIGVGHELEIGIMPISKGLFNIMIENEEVGSLRRISHSWMWEDRINDRLAALTIGDFIEKSYLMSA